MKNICFFSGDITRSGGTERVGSVVANELAKNEEFNICFLSLWEKQENSFFDIAQNIKTVSYTHLTLPTICKDINYFKMKLVEKNTKLYKKD